MEINSLNSEIYWSRSFQFYILVVYIFGHSFIHDDADATVQCQARNAVAEMYLERQADAVQKVLDKDLSICKCLGVQCWEMLIPSMQICRLVIVPSDIQINPVMLS